MFIGGGKGGWGGREGGMEGKKGGLLGWDVVGFGLWREDVFLSVSVSDHEGFVGYLAESVKMSSVCQSLHSPFSNPIPHLP